MMQFSGRSLGLCRGDPFVDSRDTWASSVFRCKFVALLFVKLDGEAGDAELLSKCLCLLPPPGSGCGAQTRS